MTGFSMSTKVLYQIKYYFSFIRYEPRNTDLDEDKRQKRVDRVNSDLLKKLKELDTDLNFSAGMWLMMLWLYHCCSSYPLCNLCKLLSHVQAQSFLRRKIAYSLKWQRKTWMWQSWWKLLYVLAKTLRKVERYYALIFTKPFCITVVRTQ